MAAKKPKDGKPKKPKGDGEAKPKKGGGGGGGGGGCLKWFAILVLLVLVYALSVFPAVWLNRHLGQPAELTQAIAVIYWPVNYAYHAVPAFREAYDWGFARMGDR
jgi:hypothetical protein